MLRRLEHFCSFHATGKENGKITGFQALRRFAAVRYALLRSVPAKDPPRLGAPPEAGADRSGGRRPWPAGSSAVGRAAVPASPNRLAADLNGRPAKRISRITSMRSGAKFTPNLHGSAVL
jgi:hypothetical protein